MNAQLLMKTAVLAGELMLKNGAETYRVEDTMSHILMTAENLESLDVLVIMTGITATLKVKNEDAITVMRRVEAISTNMNIIVGVNEISRELCDKRITLEEAYKNLTKLNTTVYSEFVNDLGNVFICMGFVVFFGGGIVEVLSAAFVGLVFNKMAKVSDELELHDFLKHIVISISVAFMSTALENILQAKLDMDVVMISCIMPLVPGMAITNAARDLLKGDYLSGAARILEAFLRAAGIAIGIGLGFALFGKLI